MLLSESSEDAAQAPAAPAAPDETAVADFPKKLAILVSMGKSKEALGEQLTHEQLKKMSDKSVKKLQKRYEAWVGSKTTETLLDSFLMLATKAVGAFLPICRPI